MTAQPDMTVATMIALARAAADARRDIAIATMLALAMAARPPLPAGQGLPAR
jgi:hypothetical protein